jgi:hypothetical protein
VAGLFPQRVSGPSRSDVRDADSPHLGGYFFRSAVRC